MVTCGSLVKKLLECLKQAFGVERTTLFIIMPLVALVLCFPALANEKRPNIVIMLADNVGWGDIGIYGGGMSVFKQMGQMFGLAKGVFCSSFSCYAACRW